MLRAYHMIGLSALDTGRMLEPGHQVGIIERVTARYYAIVANGVLRPFGGERSADQEGRMFQLDTLAGDTSFVFLSVGKRYWQPIEAMNYGFVFVAEQLLEQGAILRRRDLLGDYEELLEEVVEHFVPFSDPADWTPEQQQALFQSLETDHDLLPFSSNDAYYSLKDAIEQQDFTKHPLAEQATTLLKEKIVARQQEVQLTGQKALVLLQSGKGHGAEILVPEQLSLDLAIARIVEGQER